MEEYLGGVDILALNHARYVDGKWTGSLDNLTSFDNILDINARAYVHLASHALPLLQQSAGSIVVVSSALGT